MRTENYDAFYYSGGRELANFCIKYAENTMPEIEKMLDHRLGGRIEIICYNTLSDHKQSNFGLEEISLNTGGFVNSARPLFSDVVKLGRLSLFAFKGNCDLPWSYLLSKD